MKAPAACLALALCTPLVVAQERPPGSPGTPTPQPYGQPAPITPRPPVDRLPLINDGSNRNLPRPKENIRQESLPLLRERLERDVAPRTQPNEEGERRRQP